LVLTVAIVLTLLVGAVTFAMGGRSCIPSTQISSLLLLALLACAGALCVITGRMGWLILQGSSPHSLLTMGMAGALFSPTLCLCGWHVVLWWQARPRVGCAQEALNNRESAKVIRRLARDMGLPPDTVERTAEAPQGPFVRGTSRRRFHLCLPYDLDDRALRECGGDRPQAASLLRLVLAHELAHVRNGDIRFLPLLTAARRTLPWCFGVIVAGALLIDGFGMEAQVIGLARGMVSILIVGGTALWVLLTLALRERERLADATATLFVSPTAVSGLTQVRVAQETNLPPLMALLAGLRMGWFARKRVLGFGSGERAGTASWWRFWIPSTNRGSTLEQFQKEVTQRSQALESKEHAEEEFLAKTWVAVVVAGLLAGLLLGAFAHFVALDFFGRLLEFRGYPANPVSAGFLKAYPVWTEEQAEGLGWSVTRTLAPLLTAMLLVGTVLLPWRDAARKIGWGGEQAWRPALLALILALILAGVVFGITSPGHFPFPSFPMLRVSGLGLWLWSGVAALMFSGLLVVRSHIRHLRRIFLESLFLLGLVVADGVICLWLLQGLSVAGRLTWTFALLLIPSFLLTLGPLRRILAQEDYADESLRFVRILGFGRLFCNPLGGRLRLTRPFVFWLAGYFFVVFCLPGLLLGFPLRQSILKLDTARFERARIQGIELARLLEVATDRIPAERSAFAKESLPLLVRRRLYDPVGLRPSTWLGIAALAGGCLLGFCVSGVRALWIPRRSLRVLASAGSMAELFERLELPRVQARFRSRLVAALPEKRGRVMEVTGVPRLLRTCRVLECAARLGVALEPRQEMMAWVLACESPQGGFGPDRQVTLQHTVAVLRMLRRLKARPLNDWYIHEHWLRKLLADCWRRRQAMAPSAWLEANGLIVEGLEQVEGALPDLAGLELFGRQVVQEAFRIWQASDQATLDTKHLVTILSVWQQPARSLAAELQTSWVVAWEKHLATLHPETGLKELADSVTLLSRLFPMDYAQRASVVQVADNLEKLWHRPR
jgi:hypothetical protein